MSEKTLVPGLTARQALEALCDQIKLNSYCGVMGAVEAARAVLARDDARAEGEWKVGDPDPSPREIIMRVLSAPGDVALEGWAPICRRIELALAGNGYVIRRARPLPSAPASGGGR